MKGQAFISATLLVALIGCSKSETAPGAATPDGKPTTGTTAPTTAVKELKIETLKPGTGEGAKNGDTLTMLYRGTLVNGAVFDGNMDGDAKADMEKPPFSLALGMGTVIQGWDKGLVGCKTGELRKLTIPAEMGYGATGSGEKIPPNSDLIFTVKCLGIVKTGEEMVIDTKDLKVGTGAEVKKGDKVSIHYVGTLLNGKKFDSSRDRKKEFEFTVGNAEVVPGFDKGLLGMKKGGHRILTIPPAAAYGANPMGGIPPNSVLNFDIELMKINGK